MPKAITSDKRNNDNNGKSTDKAAASATVQRAKVFDALHAEMELADYAVAPSGHKVKRVPRNQVVSRHAKRKKLQEVDKKEMTIEADDNGVSDSNDGGGDRKRLRGSKVAFDDVVLKSMPITVPALPALSGVDGNIGANNNDIGEEEEDAGAVIADEDDDRYEILQDVAALGIDLRGVDKEESDEESSTSQYEQSEDEDEQYEEDQVVKAKSQPSIAREVNNLSSSVSKKGKAKNAKQRRLMHRLRDFASQKLAEKHGEAIGAHIQGMSETAVQKLREVSKSAPSAPQVYSSLGMVFESMLTEIQGDKQAGGELGQLQRRMELAQKAYASYHIASLLTKRDFVLWERSGDAAMRVAQLYAEIIDSADVIGESDLSTKNTTSTSQKGFDPNSGAEKWCADRKLWVEHALSAYRSSDNLRPPGVNIPCKLAQVHMTLGNCIDALSILTDLRNKASGKDGNNNEQIGRSEMEGSYPCWLLYADLMMKIGHECRMWNEGSSTNQNYMLKRWLRKHAKNFGWEERRLQALCLALEAAAGSASCVKLIKWMKERAEKYHVNIEIENVTEAGDDENDGEGDKKESENAMKESGEKAQAKSTYDEEREKLLNMNKVEMEKCDRETKEMNLIEGSHVYNDRMSKRAAMAEKHRTAMKDLAVRKFGEEQQQRNKNCHPELSTNDISPNPLPMQGSCATVYDIAALLLRQCIQMKLFNGGIFAVQTVVDYSKARASRYEKKKEQQRENAALLQDSGGSGQGLVQEGFKYDQINFDSDDSDDEGGIGQFVSDDEDLDQPEVLQSLKSGRLPVDIRAMHAICLLGAGGQDYVAMNYVEQVFLSNEMDLFSKDDHNRDISSIDDEEKYANAPMSKSFLLACICDVVMGNNIRDHSRSTRVLRIFRKHLHGVDSNQGRNRGLDDVLTSSNKLDRDQTLKILLTTLNLMIECAKMDLTSIENPNEEEAKIVEKGVSDSIYTLEMMLRFQLWNPDYSEWTLPQTSMDMVTILAGALSNLVQATSLSKAKGLVDLVQVGSMKARHLIATICQADNVFSTQSSSSGVESWRSFPLPFSWQNSFHEKLSLRAYNLCVACCVSFFSGWEPSEFNLDVLRSSDVNFFGVTLEGPSVAGFLPHEVASTIGKQWELISTLVNNMEVLPYELHLDERTKISWYEKAMKIIEKQSIGSIPSFKEDDGLKALLSFSKLCLLSAAQSSEGNEKDELLKQSFSILLPVTQFCINKQVWQSPIGTVAIGCRNKTKMGYYLDDKCRWLGPTKSKEGAQQYVIKPAQRPRPTTRAARPPRKRSQPSTNVVKVPTSVLLVQWWTQDEAPQDKRRPPQDAQLAMKKVDDAMKNLRKSRTLSSLERSSVDVAAALLAVASFDQCNNPFACWQLAAMFAAMGTKRGNNDESFKRFLPLNSSCSPLEALDILGRADCLRAIHFLKEAQYLCTWVASVCHSHRSDELENVNMPWNNRWQVIGVVNYIIASTIDETADVLAQDNNVAGALRKWDDTAKEEFRRGKSDALILVEVNPSTDNNQTLATGDNNVSQNEMHLLDHELITNQFRTQDVVMDNNDDDYDPYEGVEVVGI